MDLREGIVVIFGDGFCDEETEEEFCVFAEDESRTHYVCMISRPGIQECATKLEHMHYKPLTPRNDLMSLRALLWNEIPWFVISVPTEEKHLLEELVGTCGLRVANGIPMMLGAGCRERFPISGENVFTLENVAGHPVYRNDDTINHAMHVMEEEAAEQIREGKDRTTN